MLSEECYLQRYAPSFRVSKNPSIGSPETSSSHPLALPSSSSEYVASRYVCAQRIAGVHAMTF